jgi:hypothetical protein
MSIPSPSKVFSSLLDTGTTLFLALARPAVWALGELLEPEPWAEPTSATEQRSNMSEDTEDVFEAEADDHVVETTDEADQNNADIIEPVDEDGNPEEPPEPDTDLAEDEGDAGQPGGLLLLDGEEEEDDDNG